MLHHHAYRHQLGQLPAVRQAFLPLMEMVWDLSVRVQMAP